MPANYYPTPSDSQVGSYREALIQSLEDLADDCLCLETWQPLASDPDTREDMAERAETLRRRCDELRAVLGMTLDTEVSLEG